MVQTVTGAISELISAFVDTVVELYETHISPLIASVKNGISDIAGHL